VGARPRTAGTVRRWTPSWRLPDRCFTPTAGACRNSGQPRCGPRPVARGGRPAGNADEKDAPAEEALEPDRRRLPRGPLAEEAGDGSAPADDLRRDGDGAGMPIVASCSVPARSGERTIGADRPRDGDVLRSAAGSGPACNRRRVDTVSGAVDGRPPPRPASTKLGSTSTEVRLIDAQFAPTSPGCDWPIRRASKSRPSTSCHRQFQTMRCSAARVSRPPLSGRSFGLVAAAVATAATAFSAQRTNVGGLRAQNKTGVRDGFATAAETPRAVQTVLSQRVQPATQLQ
jgi:hypothetical protein